MYLAVMNNVLHTEYFTLIELSLLNTTIQIDCTYLVLHLNPILLNSSLYLYYNSGLVQTQTQNYFFY